MHIEAQQKEDDLEIQKDKLHEIVITQVIIVVSISIHLGKVPRSIE